MDSNARNKLKRAYENDRADDMWYNMQTGEMGVLAEPDTDDKRVSVITMTVLPLQTRWYKCSCVRMWGVFKSARMFIHEYMQPIYDACTTLGMLEHAKRVHDISCALCTDEGEGFVGEMLDTLVACGNKDDVVSHAVYDAVREYIEERL